MYKKPEDYSDCKVKSVGYVDLNMNANCLGFTKFCGVSPQDVEDVALNGLITKLVSLYEARN